MTRLAIFAFLALAATARADALHAPITRNSLPADTLWDDGRAEVCVYDASGPKEGATHRFTATSFVVKEDMDLAERVKSDAGPVPGRTATVLKQNVFYTIPTGVYAHHLMSSAFYDRDAWRLLKCATSSQDGCGLTYTETLAHDSTLVRTAHSYWQGEADRVDTLAAATAVMMDAMPLWLRGMNIFWRGSFTLPVIPSQMNNRLGAWRVEPATIEFLGKEPLVVPAGSYDAAVHVRVTAAKTVDDFWFDARFPFPLVQWWRGDGTRFALRKYLRLDYWKYAKPGDERMLN